ncbi:MAG TPA: hypothetical protein VMM81_08790, partial [Acidimicrobiia bacterium]|nr:hypothetical protein [Acidimicrobiia bacterium]
MRSIKLGGKLPVVVEHPSRRPQNGQVGGPLSPAVVEGRDGRLGIMGEPPAHTVAGVDRHDRPARHRRQPDGVVIHDHDARIPGKHPVEIAFHGSTLTTPDLDGADRQGPFPERADTGDTRQAIGEVETQRG